MSTQLAAVLSELLSKRPAEALRQEMEKPAEERRDAATVVNEVMEDWLFQTPVIVAKSKAAKRPDYKPRGGHQIDPSNLRKLFNLLLTDAKLRRLRFHDLRHTFASLLLQNGESPAYVKDPDGPFQYSSHGGHIRTLNTRRQPEGRGPARRYAGDKERGRSSVKNKKWKKKWKQLERISDLALLSA
jgi:integrase